MQGLGDTTLNDYSLADRAGWAERCTILIASVRAMLPVVNLNVSRWIGLLTESIASVVLLRSHNITYSDSGHGVHDSHFYQFRIIPMRRKYQGIRLRGNLSVRLIIPMLLKLYISIH